MSDGEADRFENLLSDDPTDERFDVLEADEADLRDRWPPDETRLLTALLHAHVPKLDDADVVDFDRDERLLEEGRRWSAAEELLAVERSLVDGAPGSTWQRSPGARPRRDAELEGEVVGLPGDEVVLEATKHSRGGRDLLDEVEITAEESSDALE